MLPANHNQVLVGSAKYDLAMTTPVGPYTPAVRSGDWLICSGQIGIADGALVEGGFAAQTEQVMKNVASLLEANGATMQDVVKSTVFVTDLANYGVMNDIYCAAFGDHRPARSAVQVAGLPLGAEVEVEVWARLTAD